MMVMLGELGGIQEIMVANAVKRKLLTKPIVGWCMGTANEFFNGTVQFGHAGSNATEE